MNRQPEQRFAEIDAGNGRLVHEFKDRNVRKTLILLKKSTDYRMLQLK